MSCFGTSSVHPVVPSLLIKINHAKWYGDLPWLKVGEVQAAALWDLRQSDNRLSVWSIPDDTSNLQRIVAALAATRENIENLDYVLLQSASLSALNIGIEKTNGATPDAGVNAEYHLDLIELTISKIVSIANLIKLSAEKDRVQSFDVKKYLVKSYESGYLDQGLLKAKLLGKIQEAAKLQKETKPPV